MDANAEPTAEQLPEIWRPENCDRVALVLQGGGALGAYQAGVYEALHHAGLEPDWLTGVSIGAINAAIIAGNPRERRLDRLREFWAHRVSIGAINAAIIAGNPRERRLDRLREFWGDLTARQIWPFTPDGDAPRRARNGWSAMVTMMSGQPGFFDVNVPGPLFSPRGAKQATSYYDSAPLKQTLLKLVDFDLINSRKTRFACGAVNVARGNFAYFDNADIEIVPEHVMASGALPPALPMVPLGTDYFWDGGLVSNTPLQHLLDFIGAENVLVFQVDLFSASGAIPRDMPEVMARQKDIMYSSRTRLTTDLYGRMHKMKLQMRSLLERIPDDQLSDEERAQKQTLQNLPEIAIMLLIYQQAAYEGQAKDYEFSNTSMREHWAMGRADTEATLRHKEWMSMPKADQGIVMHDIHRPNS